MEANARYIIFFAAVIISLSIYAILSMTGMLQINHSHNQTKNISPLFNSQMLKIEPKTQTVDDGESFSINITIADAKQLYGFQFDLSYDPSILKFHSIEESQFLKIDSSPVFCVPYDTSTEGSIRNVACTRLGKVGGVNGKGILAKITFTSHSSGNTEIQLSNAKLSVISPETNKLQSITLNISSAQIYVRP